MCYHIFIIQYCQSQSVNQSHQQSMYAGLIMLAADGYSRRVRPMTAGRHRTPQTATGHYF